MEELRNACKILFGKSEGKSLLGRPRHRWKGFLKLDLQQIGYEGVKRIHVTQDVIQWWALQNTAMNLQLP
jgi:hypothetical protein